MFVFVGVVDPPWMYWIQSNPHSEDKMCHQAHHAQSCLPTGDSGKPLEAVFLIPPEETCDIKSWRGEGGSRQPFPRSEGRQELGLASTASLAKALRGLGTSDCHCKAIAPVLPASTAFPREQTLSLSQISLLIF